MEAVRRLNNMRLTRAAFVLYDFKKESSPTLLGMLCLHVDDILAAGDPNSKIYVDAEIALKKAFDFRTFETDEKTLEYCGGHDHCWKVNQHDYIQKVKPVTIHKGRTAENEMNDHDRSQLRALLGSLQWPAVQTAPHL